MPPKKKLHVEVVNARGLMPKDGQGSANAYVTLDYEKQRIRTKVKDKELNPTWNEKFDFMLPDGGGEGVLEVNVYNDRKMGRPSGFLGRVRIPLTDLAVKGKEAVKYFKLEKRSLFSHIRGEIGLKIYTEELPPPKSPAAPAAGAAAAPGAGGAAPAAPAAPAPAPAAAGGGDPPAPPAAAGPPPAAAAPPKPKPEPKTATSVDPKEYILKNSDARLGGVVGEIRQTVPYDLVEEMPYLFVKLVKARGLTALKDVKEGNATSSDPYAKISVGSLSAKSKIMGKNLNPEWNQVFAFAKGNLHGGTLQIEIFDEPEKPEKDKPAKDPEFLGVVMMDVGEVPSRKPPESPLAPQWYKLVGPEGRVKGDLMLAVWMGTQADEAFPDAWQSDTGGNPNSRSKVYMSPKLWYLRVKIIEAQDLLSSEKGRVPEPIVKTHLGSQTYNTKPSKNKSTSPMWDEDLMFVAAEPFEEVLHLMVEDGPKKELLGQVKIPLNTIERRIDGRQVGSRWYVLEKDDKGQYRGRIHLRLCFDGGYHVMEESNTHTSCMRPAAKQLWKPPVGILELGILGATGLLPMKTNPVNNRASTDSYCVAKYGQKWIRTRTITDNFNPRWNEQYTWDVYDPCTVLTVCVFDNKHLQPSDKPDVKDVYIGKVRIRLSTLENDRVYTNLYPLLMLTQSGVKKHGELELAVRFSVGSMFNVMQIYLQPPLPHMHYYHPLDRTQLEFLRSSAMKIVQGRLARTEPPLRPEVVSYVLDTESTIWSMRRSKANFHRILSVLSSFIGVYKWFQDVCKWENRVTTVLVHVLFLILVWYPELILPTVFLYFFLIGAWNYRFRPQAPPFMDAKLSQGDQVGDPDELEEEFGVLPNTKTQEILKQRYDRLRNVSSKIQNGLGELASQGERFQYLLSWRDPRATLMFVLFCIIAAVVLYITPFRVVAVLLGIYIMRPPSFRDPLPPVPLNFFRRLPSAADRIL